MVVIGYVNKHLIFIIFELLLFTTRFNIFLHDWIYYTVVLNSDATENSEIFTYKNHIFSPWILHFEKIIFERKRHLSKHEESKQR